MRSGRVACDGLLAKHLDIGFHIYSEPPLLPSGAAAMLPVSRKTPPSGESNASTCCTGREVRRVARMVRDRDGDTAIDMIHIETGSAYDGYFSVSPDGCKGR
ncbi:MAG: hypothetical protein ACLR76_08390 [Alistipes sp.]